MIEVTHAQWSGSQWSITLEGRDSSLYLRIKGVGKTEDEAKDKLMDVLREAVSAIRWEVGR